MESGEPKILARISSHTDHVNTVCFSPDQTKICSAGLDRNVILTSLQNYQTEKIFKGHKDSIWESDFSRDGNLIATCSCDKTVRIWNVESKKGKSKVLKGHFSTIYTVRFFPNDPSKVVSGSYDRTFKIWNIKRKKPISTLKCCEDGVETCESVDILPDNHTIATGGRELRIWDIRSKKQFVKVVDKSEKGGLFRSVQFHPNSFSLASGSHTIRIFDIRNFQVRQTHQFVPEESTSERPVDVNSVCFHPSGKYLVAAVQFDVKLYDLSEKKVMHKLNDHLWIVRSVQFSPDGKFFASGSTGDSLGDPTLVESSNNVFLWSFFL